MGIHPLKPQNQPLTGGGFRQTHEPLIVIFRIIFNIKPLHDQRRGRKHIRPFAGGNGIERIVLLPVKGGRYIPDGAGQKLPFTIGAVRQNLRCIVPTANFRGNRRKIGDFIWLFCIFEHIRYLPFFAPLF